MMDTSGFIAQETNFLPYRSLLSIYFLIPGLSECLHDIRKICLTFVMKEKLGINPSTPQPEGWGLLRADPERRFIPWRRRMGQRKNLTSHFRIC